MKLKSNKIRCKKCGDVIESKRPHDFKWCSCHSVAIDGGLSYKKRCYSDYDLIEDLSEYED